MGDIRIILVGTLVNKDIPNLGPMVGLGYIEQYLRSYGINSLTYDLRIDSLPGLVEIIETHRPEFVGFYLATMNYANNLNLIKGIKERFPDINIVVGGPHVSTMRQKLLQEYQFIDYGCVLEGEDLLKELILNEKDISEIKGLLYRDPSGGVIFNGERPLRRDLDQYLFPKYESANLVKYSSTIISIITSRGCPYSCTYCPVSTTIGKKFRIRTPENIILELEYWVSQGYKEFYFIDDNFTLIKERVIKLCQLIMNTNLHRQITISLPNGIRADKADYEMLSIMRNSGFSAIAFGVESANDHVLKLMKKGEKLESIDKAINIAIKLGYNVRLFFIIGHPGESFADFMNSIKFAKKYPVSGAGFVNLIPFPETELISWVRKYNWYIDKNEINLVSLGSYAHHTENPIFETPEMSREERIKAYRIGVKTANEIRYNYFKRKFIERFPYMPGLHWIAFQVFNNSTFQFIYQRNSISRKYIEKFKSYLVHSKIQARSGRWS